MSFNEDQPRDELGRWTGDGGGPGAVGADSAKVWAATNAQTTEAQDLYAESAARGYVSGGDVLNYFLRTDEADRLSERDSTTISELDSIIAAQEPTTQDTVLYRGVAEGAEKGSPEYEETTQPPPFGTMQPGEEFTDRGFASTTTNFETAQSFARSSGTILEVHAPAGTQGLSVAGMPGMNYLSEDEVILPRGSVFQVLEPVDPMTGILKVSIKE